jgi:hypothetical protein
MQNRNYSVDGTCGRQQGGHSRNARQLIDHSLLVFAAPISSIGSNHHNRNSNSLQKIYASGQQSNLRSICADLSGAATEKGKFAVIT